MSPYRVDARLSGRHPFEIYILVLTLIVAIPTLLGITPRPGSVSGLLPGLPGFLWSLILTVGAGVALVGIYWKNRATGLILEQLGLALVGVANLVYAIAALVVVDAAAIPAAIVGGFGLSCLRRYWQIQGVLKAVQTAQGIERRISTQDHEGPDRRSRRESD